MHPRLATVVCAAQVTTVAADPASFAVEKVDGIEIVSAGVDLERDPTALGSRSAGEGQQENNGRKKL